MNTLLYTQLLTEVVSMVHGSMNTFLQLTESVPVQPFVILAAGGGYSV